MILSECWAHVNNLPEEGLGDWIECGEGDLYVDGLLEWRFGVSELDIVYLNFMHFYYDSNIKEVISAK